MNQKEMLNICKEKGLTLTPPLLYRAGKREGFLIKISDDKREKYQVDMKKFNQWLDKNNVDKNYISIGEASRKTKISFSGLKYQLEARKCEIKKMGLIDGGTLYAKRTDIETIVAEYKRRTVKEEK